MNETETEYVNRIENTFPGEAEPQSLLSRALEYDQHCGVSTHKKPCVLMSIYKCQAVTRCAYIRDQVDARCPYTKARCSLSVHAQGPGGLWVSVYATEIIRSSRATH